MGLDVGQLLNDFVDACLNKPYVKAISRNPIYTTLLIVTIMVLMLLFIFRNEKTNESISAIVIRFGIYAFGAILAVIFLHNKVLMIDIHGSAQDSDLAQTFAPISLAGEQESFIPVHLPDEYKL